jgi:hypothetical protein
MARTSTILERLAAASPARIPADVKLRAAGMIVSRASVGDVSRWLNRQGHTAVYREIHEWARIHREHRDQ